MRWSSTSTRTYGARRVFTRIRFATTRPSSCHMRTSCASLLPPVMRRGSSRCGPWLRKAKTGRGPTVVAPSPAAWLRGEPVRSSKDYRDEIIEDERLRLRLLGVALLHEILLVRGHR